MGFDTELWRIPAVIFWILLAGGSVFFGCWGLWRFFLWLLGRIGRGGH